MRSFITSTNPCLSDARMCGGQSTTKVNAFRFKDSIAVLRHTIANAKHNPALLYGAMPVASSSKTTERSLLKEDT